MQTFVDPCLYSKHVKYDYTNAILTPKQGSHRA